MKQNKNTVELEGGTDLRRSNRTKDSKRVKKFGGIEYLNLY